MGENMPKISDNLIERTKQPNCSKDRIVLRDSTISGFQVVISSKSIAFRLQRVLNGKRISHIFGHYPLIRTHEARELAIKSHLSNEVSLRVVQKKSTESVQDLLARYTSSKQLAPATIKSMHKSFKQGLSDWLGKSSTNLTASAFESVYRSMLNRGVASSARMLARYVRAVYRWAELPDPTEKLTQKTGVSANKVAAKDRRIEPHQLEAFKQVMPTLAANQQLAIMAALVTGMRKSELQSLTAINLDHSTHSIKLAKTKNGKAHQIPLPNKLWEQLVSVAANKPKDASLLEIGDKLPKAFTRVIPLSWHDCRRTCASTLAANGVSEALIKTILNHSDRGNVTQAHYLRFDIEKQRGVLTSLADYFNYF